MNREQAIKEVNQWLFEYYKKIYSNIKNMIAILLWFYIIGGFFFIKAYLRNQN